MPVYAPACYTHITLTVIEVNGQRNLEVNELVGWRCNLGTGQTCAGRTYADVLVGSDIFDLLELFGEVG